MLTIKNLNTGYTFKIDNGLKNHYSQYKHLEILEDDSVDYNEDLKLEEKLNGIEPVNETSESKSKTKSKSKK